MQLSNGLSRDNEAASQVSVKKELVKPRDPANVAP